MVQQMIDRQEELKFLEKKYNSNKAELIVIYGRRRIGKTFLIKKFLENNKGIYFFCRKESKNDTLKRLSLQCAKFFNDLELLNRPFQNIDNFFQYIYEKSKNKRVIFVLDEFPYLLHEFNNISFILQDWWDNYLTNTKIMLILCGSSVSMIEKTVLSSESPLYGRRTGQWKMEKLNPIFLKEFFPKYNLKDLIISFSCLDTIPGYLVKFDSKKDVYWNIKYKILTKGEFLYSEGEFLLYQELRDPSNYLSILKAIASGATKFGDIVNLTQLDKSLVSKYLYVLENLGFVKKEFPFGINYKGKLKGKGLYVISDNYMRFWLRYVYNYYDLLEIGEIEKVFNLIDFNEGFPFEEFCRRLIKHKTGNVYRWWHNNKEIDIVAYDDSKLIFGECKWKDNINAEKICKELIEKIQYVDIPKELENHKKELWIFAKSFKNKIDQYEDYSVKCFDLNDLNQLLKETSIKS